MFFLFIRENCGRFIFIAILFSLFLGEARAQLLSPGPLNKAHKHLEGLKNCKKCHEGRREVSSGRCLNCHKPLNQRIKRRRGFHGRMARSKLFKCGRCHKEHRGERFPLIFWRGGMDKFSHDLTGFILRGEHRDLKCRKCHKPAFIKDRDVIEYKKKWGALVRTFLGLSEKCVSCHKDPHRGEVSKNCQRCHSENAWSPADRFEHSKTRFPLRNRHAEVKCIKCHEKLPGGGKGAFKFSVSRNCRSCHEDPHRGRMTKNCRRCHTDKGWKDIIFSLKTHAPRKFPLTGAHRQIYCSDCHGKDLTRSPVPRACVSCHKSPHPPTFSKRCNKCHNTFSWFTNRFTRKDHDKTRFPLRGAHMKVPCSKCHPGNSKGRGKGRFKFRKELFTDCSPCHRDVHWGQFSRRGYRECKECHVEDSFTPSTFTISKHQKLKFSLNGAHLAIPCRNCHRVVELSSIDFKPISPAPSPVLFDSKRYAKALLEKRVIKFLFSNLRCSNCHEDPHKGKYDRVIEKRDCAGCHSEDNWFTINNFDHSLTSFPLTGKHKGVKCVKCHWLEKRKDGFILPHYKPLNKNCSSCHKDVHFGQFSRISPIRKCDFCHTTEDWKGASKFDHNKARFKLTGKHKDVKCSKCHFESVISSRKGSNKVVIYRPIRYRKCVYCHDNYHKK